MHPMAYADSFISTNNVIAWLLNKRGSANPDVFDLTPLFVPNVLKIIQVAFGVFVWIMSDWLVRKIGFRKSMTGVGGLGSSVKEMS